jgi:DNA-binding response OmpR family regulator
MSSAFPHRLLSSTEHGLTHLPRRVLLVEPSPAEATRFHNELIASKFEVYVARDLITATRAISIFQPNIILTRMALN